MFILGHADPRIGSILVLEGSCIPYFQILHLVKVPFGDSYYILTFYFNIFVWKYKTENQKKKKKKPLIFQYFGLVRKGQTNIFFLGLRLKKKKKKKNLYLKACDRLEDLTLNAFFLILFFVLFCFVLFFFFFLQQMCKVESVTTLVQYKLCNLIFGWTRYKIKINQEHRVKEVCCPMCFIVSYLFLYILTARFIKTGKNLNKNKIKIFNFAESNAHHKTNTCGSFET